MDVWYFLSCQLSLFAFIALVIHLYSRSLNI